MMVSRSPFSHARTYRSRRARSTAPASGDQSARGPTRSSSAARARWRALFAEDTEHARAAAVSAAESPTTSRSRSTARCGGVSTCSAATNASATLSFIVYCAAGLLPSGAAPASQADGAGSSHSVSGVRAAGGAWDRRRAELRSAGAARALRELVEAHVGGDAVEPGARARGVLQGVLGAEGADERLLHHVVAVVRRAQHAVAVEPQRRAVRLHEGGEGVHAASRAAAIVFFMLSRASMRPSHAEAFG